MVERSEDHKRKTRSEKVTRIVNMNAQQKINEDSAIEDARSALLAHYSSKSSNETAILLGLAVAFFATVQAYIEFKDFLLVGKATIFTVILGFMLFLTLRQVGRLVYWGELASAITVVDMLGENVTQYNLDRIKNELDSMKEEISKEILKKKEKESEEKKKNPLEGVNVVSSPILRLNYASSRYVDFYRKKCKENNRNGLICIFRITHNEWFPLFYVALITTFLSLAFAFRLFS